MRFRDHNFNGEQDPNEPGLLDRISFFSRADDLRDNNNNDGDRDPHTGFDELRECRIPGRINVNTAPVAVLRAAVPPLVPMDPANLIDPTYTDFSQTIAENIGERNPSDLYENVRDIFNGPGGFPFQQVYTRPEIGRADVDVIDLKEKYWVTSHLANLLTVRSDTFTAYIAIRVQDRNNPAENYTERRYVAILDRSNVFLPKWAGENGFHDEDGDGILDPAEGFDGDYFGEPFNDRGLPNPNGWYHPGLDGVYVDLNGNGRYDYDESGELGRYNSDGTQYGPVGQGIADPDYFDRQYCWPKVVSFKPASEPR
jgi:hypothetical protein